MQLPQGLDHAQDLVVCFALGQAAGQRDFEVAGLEKQTPTHLFVPRAVERQAHRHIGTGMGRQTVQAAAGLARIAGHLGHAFFVPIEFFQNDHGQKNIVLFKSKQAHGVVHQHVGVEHKQFGRTGGDLFLGLGFWLAVLRGFVSGHVGFAGQLLIQIQHHMGCFIGHRLGRGRRRAL